MPLQQLTITNTTHGFPLPRKKIAQAVKIACLESKKRVSLSLVFVPDREISKLHWLFMQDRSATDVLTFMLSQSAGALETEIYISLDTARIQAGENGVSLQNELVRLATHGVLHAIGYDDRTPRLRKRMWQRQEYIVAKAFSAKKRDIHG
ncbi:MAG TPA: rRNA maturation RNase YbeY [Candidatus Kapabacteria bacterium]|nr:rRNA maturation RNase YbeY [Candidatus Kapabacteria bacterium]